MQTPAGIRSQKGLVLHPEFQKLESCPFSQAGLEPEWTFGAALRPEPAAPWEGRRLGRRRRSTLPAGRRQGREAPPSAPARPRSLSAAPLGCPAGSVPMSSLPPQLHSEKWVPSVHKTFADAPHNKKQFLFHRHFVFFVYVAFSVNSILVSSS